MNDLLEMMQNFPSGGRRIPDFHFRDIFKILLLAAALRIVNKAYDVVERITGTPSLPMNTNDEEMRMLGLFGNGKEE